MLLIIIVSQVLVISLFEIVRYKVTKHFILKSLTTSSNK